MRSPQLRLCLIGFTLLTSACWEGDTVNEGDRLCVMKASAQESGLSYAPVLHIEIPTTEHQQFVCPQGRSSAPCAANVEDGCYLEAIGVGSDEVSEFKLRFQHRVVVASIELFELFDQTCSPSPFAIEPNLVELRDADTSDNIFFTEATVYYRPTTEDACEATLRLKTDAVNIEEAQSVDAPTEFLLRLKG